MIKCSVSSLINVQSKILNSDNFNYFCLDFVWFPAPVVITCLFQIGSIIKYNNDNNNDNEINKNINNTKLMCWVNS
jgi:hypothetical protein